jgi:hypothetical protein
MRYCAKDKDTLAIAKIHWRQMLLCYSAPDKFHVTERQHSAVSKLTRHYAICHCVDKIKIVIVS